MLKLKVYVWGAKLEFIDKCAREEREKIEFLNKYEKGRKKER